MSESELQEAIESVAAAFAYEQTHPNFPIELECEREHESPDEAIANAEAFIRRIAKEAIIKWVLGDESANILKRGYDGP
jgi:hypothetical protein